MKNLNVKQLIFGTNRQETRNVLVSAISRAFGFQVNFVDHDHLFDHLRYLTLTLRFPEIHDDGEHDNGRFGVGDMRIVLKKFLLREIKNEHPGIIHPEESQ